ncbi:MAG: type II toxin-antitoxin system Phd/YefM family antitoxin [Caldilineaceae bacterium]|nr:type II toxin-antitoxin system Phd/YefM family antitoxin [Caldilineaceae bacterium]
MKEVGIRELKSHLTSIVRNVREEQVEYVVTSHGAPVAVLRPYSEIDVYKARQDEIRAELAAMDELSRAIGEAWSSPKSGVEILEEMREERP